MIALVEGQAVGGTGGGSPAPSAEAYGLFALAEITLGFSQDHNTINRKK